MSIDANKDKNSKSSSNQELEDFSFLSKMKEILDTLHKHLPDKFPNVDYIDEKRGITGIIRKGTVSLRAGGLDNEYIFIEPEEEKSNTAVDIHILFHFLQNLDKMNDRTLWISNLPWTFNGSEFYRTYANELGHDATAEMLMKIGYSRGDLNKYRNRFSEHIQLSKFELFEIEIKKHPLNSRLSLDELLNNIDIDVTLQEIKKWYDEKKFKKNIEINFKRKDLKIWEHKYSKK